MFTKRKKSESHHYFKKYHRYAETHAGKKVNKVNNVYHYTVTLLPTDLHDVFKQKILLSDNAGEYISNSFSSEINKHGIQHQFTALIFPRQTRVTERMSRTLLNHTRLMLPSRNISRSFWAEAFPTAVHL